MTLTFHNANGPAFNKAAIMGWAHREGRFALRMCRTLAERRQQLSLWLRKAWATAKAKAAELLRAAERTVATRADLAARAAQADALAASYGSADASRQAITSEHYRDRMNFAAVDRLEAALSSLNA
jgi:predicted amino acid dehydrogenase